jgi:DNA-directed RNA polymerase subunit beta
VARDSRAVIVPEEAGKVASVTGNQIIITEDGKLPETKKKIRNDAEKGVWVYQVRKFHALQRRDLHQPKDLVRKGESGQKRPGS